MARSTVKETFVDNTSTNNTALENTAVKNTMGNVEDVCNDLNFDQEAFTISSLLFGCAYARFIDQVGIQDHFQQTFVDLYNTVLEALVV